MIQEKYSSTELQAIEQEAHYHLGRVLYLGELDFDRAVSELEEVVEQDKSNVPALYYLGLAIRAQIERNKLTRAQQVLREYLARGAPIGDEDTVRELLGARLTTPVDQR